MLSDRHNIVVIADEAHRTQYGFDAKLHDIKDKDNNVIGQKVSYGFAKYMHDALPNATYIGFTGTPVESKDANTPAVFGNYIDIYDIAQAVEDKITVKIYYESRLAKVNLTEEGRALVEQFDTELESPSENDEELSDADEAKAKWTTLEKIVGNPERIKNVANDIVRHFEARQEVFDGKAIIVAMSRRIAVDLYDAIISLRPEWHNNDLDEGCIKVVMTSMSSDGPNIQKHHTTKSQRKALAARMKDVNDPLRIVIVRDMWLTGFDAPCLHTMYVDKPMKGHNLMQAIARVNRVFLDKPGGLIVDYIGIGTSLKQALNFYAESGGKGMPAENQIRASEIMIEKLEVVRQMLHGFDYTCFFDASVKGKLSIILQAENHILGLPDGKARFVKEVSLLGQAYALSKPSDEAMKNAEEIAFFQAIKARLCKFDGDKHESKDRYESTIYQHIIPQLGKIPLCQLTQKDLQQFYAHLKKEGRLVRTEQFGKGLSDRMVRMCHAKCRAALDQAVQENLIRTNPAVGCKLPPKRSPEMQVLSRQELQRFLIQAKADGYFELFLLDLSTGLRRGELLALQWSDLDLDTGTLSVTKQVYEVNGKMQLSVPKTKASIRKLVLPPAVVEVFREYRKTAKSRWLFPSPKNLDMPLTPGSMLRRLHIILERAGCKQIRFHDLRHTFATMALENGMDIKTLSAMLGHVSAATTLDIYTHITSDMLNEAAAKIDRGLGNEVAEDSGEANPLTDFQPVMRRTRKPGTGCITEINDHLFEGRYSPTLPDGTKHSKCVYAHTREECEEKLKVLIQQLNAERKAILDRLRGIPSPEKLTKKQRQIWEYMKIYPDDTNYSAIAKGAKVTRHTVAKHFEMIQKMLGIQKTAPHPLLDCQTVPLMV